MAGRGNGTKRHAGGAFLALVCGSLLSLISSHSEAAEFSIEKGNCCATIVVSGPIERGDAERFKAYWEKNGNWREVYVALDSPGGSLLDGIEIGRFLREQLADTAVDRYAPRTPDMHDYDLSERLSGAECFSACALAFMGGRRRQISDDASIGFHQFSGGSASTTDEAMERTQYISAMIAYYLRDMGAKPELFELMSMKSPEDLFVPTRGEMETLGIIPSDSFHDFRLMPKEGYIVATAINEQNPDALERVYEIETFCWQKTPIVNLYAATAERGLSPDQASPSSTDFNGFRIATEFRTFDYGSERLRLYSESRLLASFILDPEVARALGSSNAAISVEGGSTATGAYIRGRITAPPGGDPAIIASFRDCL